MDAQCLYVCLYSAEVTDRFIASTPLSPWILVNDLRKFKSASFLCFTTVLLFRNAPAVLRGTKHVSILVFQFICPPREDEAWLLFLLGLFETDV